MIRPIPELDRIDVAFGNIKHGHSPVFCIKYEEAVRK